MAVKNVTVVSHKDDVMKELQEKLELAMASCGMIAEGYAKADSPVDTGLLRNSITYAVSGNAPATTFAKADKGERSIFNGGKAPEASSDSIAVYVGTNVEYAQAQELKSMKHTTGKAHFLRDSISSHGKEYKQTVKEIMES